MNPALFLWQTARLTPQAPALFRGLEMTADYREFNRRAAAIGNRLKTCFDVAKGDRIALFSKNSTQYLEALYGIWNIGAVAVPINAKLHPREAAYIISDSEARLCFTSARLGNDLANVQDRGAIPTINLESVEFEAMHAVEGTGHEANTDAGPSEPIVLRDDDMVWLFYTSGTTGKPKGVMITCANIAAMVEAYFASVDEVHASDTAFYAAPLSHGAGIYNFQHVLRGARHAVPVSGGFEPSEIFEAGRQLGNLHLFAAPTMVKRMVEHALASGETGEGIRTIVYGGGPMYLNDIIEAVEVLGDRFCQIYGQGESPMCITALKREIVSDRKDPRWGLRLQSVGTAQQGVEVAIGDGDGNPLKQGEIGEILVRGRSVMKGYWNNPQSTQATLQNGWLWTGDMGELDEEGYLTLKDRSKDVIISGGTNIYPREVEEALLTHAKVREVSVIGKPDPQWGEIVVAFVCFNGQDKVSEKELDAHCLDQIARFKRPKEYYFVDELPKNNYGKVLKTDLRARLDRAV